MCRLVKIVNTVVLNDSSLLCRGRGAVLEGCGVCGEKQVYAAELLPVIQRRRLPVLTRGGQDLLSSQRFHSYRVSYVQVGKLLFRKKKYICTAVIRTGCHCFFSSISRGLSCTDLCFQFRPLFRD